MLQLLRNEKNVMQLIKLLRCDCNVINLKCKYNFLRKYIVKLYIRDHCDLNLPLVLRNLYIAGALI